MNNQSEVEQKAAPVTPLHSPMESGQAIVIMALLMIILLGMLGLAIDGGGLFFLRRDAQNATDAAILSASYAICTKGDPVAAALATMAQNGFNNNGITNSVTVDYPGKNANGVRDYGYVEVTLNAHKPAYFIQLVYRNPLQVTVHAVGNCIPPFDPSSVGGLWAGSMTCNDTVNWTGSNAYIDGGLFSNNEIKFKGSDINLRNGPVDAHIDIAEDNGGKVHYDPNYPPREGVPQQNDPLNLDIGLYMPGGDIASTIQAPYYHAIPDVPATFDAGDWSDTKGWSPKNGSTIEGLYFVRGDVKIGNNVEIGPKGITIVATGVIDFSGNGHDATDPAHPNTVKYFEGVMNKTVKDVRYPGILFMSSYEGLKCGQSALKISEAHASYHGIVYSPKSGVNVSGSSIYFRGTIMAQTIDYSGSSGTIIYDKALLPPRPPQIQMVE